MPLVLLPTLALAAGSALALADGGAPTAARRAEARRVVSLFAWLVLFPAALFPALIAPSWSLAGLVGHEGAAAPLLVVLSAAGATLALPAYELCARGPAGRLEGTRALVATSSALLATGLVLYLAAGRLASVSGASAGRSFAQPVSLAESPLPALLGVLLTLGALGFALSFRALRALARPSARVEPRREARPR